MIDYDEKRRIFELEARRSGVNLAKNIGSDVYVDEKTRDMWRFFVRGLEIGAGLHLNPARFEDEMFKRYGLPSDGRLEVVFKTRTVAK